MIYRFLGVVFLLALWNTSAKAAPDVAYIVADTRLVAGYRLVFLRPPEQNTVQSLLIEKDGKRLLDEGFVTPLSVLTREQSGRDALFPVPPGSDVTGDGLADLALLSTTGGKTCCYRLQIFTLEPTFKKVADIDGGHEPPRLTQLDRDAALEISTRDWTFAYWHASLADSPAPLVILDFDGERYEASAALMREAAPTGDRLEREARRLRSVHAINEMPSPELWGDMLALIYSGHADAAFAFLTDAWPSAMPGRDAFLLRFGGRLGLSPYWSVLAELNDWPDF